VAELPGIAEVVVIGGGAMGVATAFHLTRSGVRDVALIERDLLASGSSGKSAGGVRAQFADELNVKIALRSIAEFRAMDDWSSGRIGFNQSGYLFLLDNQRDVSQFRQALQLQQSLGVPSRELCVAEVEEIMPQLVTSDLVAATFCPWDGHLTPEAVVQEYARAASESGATIVQNCRVEAITTRHRRITSIETNRGRVATGIVVCCAGAWSSEIGVMAGQELPVHAERRFVWFTPQDGGLPSMLPLTIDFSTGFYLHREGPGLVFGGRDQHLDDLGPKIERRLPMLLELPIQTAWSGLYEMSPDHNAMVGESTLVSRFLYATGFSGHGFQQSPAVGEYLAELIVGKTPTLDLSAFAVDRFSSGTRRDELFVV